MAVELAPARDMANLVVDTAEIIRAKIQHAFLGPGVGKAISLFAGFVAARVA